MKKHLGLIVTSFVLMSVAAFAAVGVILFQNQKPAKAGDEIPNNTTYTVTFDYMDGKTFTTETVAANTCVEEPAKPTRKGSDFISWCSDKEGIQPFSFNTPITRDLTLFASWNVKEFTVTFVYGNTEPTTQTLYKDDKVTLPAEPVWDGYDFLGWYTDETCQKPFVANTPVTADLTLYAKWSIEFVLQEDGTYKITGYTGTAESLVVPATYRGKAVTTIGVVAFSNNDSLRSVVVEPGITLIREAAFFNCVNLAQVNLPENIQICDRAFFACPCENERQS